MSGRASRARQQRARQVAIAPPVRLADAEPRALREHYREWARVRAVSTRCARCATLFPPPAGALLPYFGCGVHGDAHVADQREHVAAVASPGDNLLAIVPPRVSHRDYYDVSALIELERARPAHVVASYAAPGDQQFVVRCAGAAQSPTHVTVATSRMRARVKRFIELQREFGDAFACRWLRDATVREEGQGQQDGALVPTVLFATQTAGASTSAADVTSVFDLVGAGSEQRDAFDTTRATHLFDASGADGGGVCVTFMHKFMSA